MCGVHVYIKRTSASCVKKHHICGSLFQLMHERVHTSLQFTSYVERDSSKKYTKEISPTTYWDISGTVTGTADTAWRHFVGSI